MQTVTLTPIEDGWWLAKVPSLPGCRSQGASQAEALSNLKEAVELYIEVLEEKGEPLPEWWYENWEPDLQLSA